MNILQLKINKTGKYHPVYSVSNSTEQIGTIYPNEAFIDYGSESLWHAIYFKDSSGNIREGMIMDQNTDTWTSNGLCETPCSDYPYGTATINGKKYKTYKMKKTKNIYTSSGNYWGGVAAGMLVATNSATTGLNHPTWKAIDYVKSTSGNWVQVDSNGSGYGFVDFDLEEGSMPSNINFYGSW